MTGQRWQPIRVVVTSVGAITAQGPTAEALWEGVKAGVCAIRPVKYLPMAGYRTHLGGEVQDRVLPRRDYRRPADFREPVIDFALKAAEEAIANVERAREAIPPERWGVVVGTCNAGLISGEKWWMDRKAGREADPTLLLLSTPQALAEALSGAFGLRGPCVSINTACAASANAIGYALDLIRFGHADAVVTGGSDAFSDVLYAGFNSLESLSPEPAAPYSRDRQGLSLGEGAGMLVLVRDDIAQRENLPVIAEIVSYGLSADGYHPTAPHPEGLGASRAIQAALKSGGVRPDEVAYVNSHGTGTAKNDPAETRATRRGLGDEAANKVAVSSTKSMIGHLLGAAGAAENIVTAKAIQEQVAPPTANFTEPDPDCDLDYVPNTARPMTIDVAISNNFAFGGANAVTVLAKAGTREGIPTPEYEPVVVTGIGALTAAGCTVDELWEAFTSGRPAASPENGVFVGRVELDATPWLSKRETRRMDRMGIFSVVATKLAAEDAGLAVDDDNRSRVGVILGTGVGPMESMEKFAEPVIEEGASAANPAVFPNTVYNAASGQVAMLAGVTGPTSTITVGHAAGVSSLSYGYDLVSQQQADAVVCIAADTLTDSVIEGYQALGLLATETPTKGGGMALGEAGVAFVVEGLSAARQRGVQIYGQVLGWSMTCDAIGVGGIDREGEGIERAMREVLQRTGLASGDITAIWANMCGHPVADAAEEAAIARVFGEDGPPVQTPKLTLAEPIGAGGAVSAVLALESWRRSGEQAGPVLINSCSLGGTNLSLVLAPVPGAGA